MAAYLSLTSRHTGEVFSGPDLIVLDEIMCNAFITPCDPARWHQDWMHWIGLALAYGRTFENILAGMDQSDPDRQIVCWLQQNYLNTSYYSR